MRKIWIALLMIASCLFAQGDTVPSYSREGSGAILTNFLPQNTTLGTDPIQRRKTRGSGTTQSFGMHLNKHTGNIVAQI
jgi:hypothetical protein